MRLKPQPIETSYLELRTRASIEVPLLLIKNHINRSESSEKVPA